MLLLHGASLGSSADVFIRNLGPLARAGFRVIAFDQPGFGLTDVPADHSPAYRRDFVPKFMDALGLNRAALVGHSQAGNPAVQLALKEPARYSHVIVLGTGSLLPPIDGAGDGEGAVQQRLERRMAHQEPSIEDTRKLLEANLFNHALITDDELALRHSRSVGQNFDAFVERNRQAEQAPAKEPKVPMWQRLAEVQVPLLLIFGREDRARACRPRQPAETAEPSARHPHRPQLQTPRPLGRRRRIRPPLHPGPEEMSSLSSRTLPEEMSSLTAREPFAEQMCSQAREPFFHLPHAGRSIPPKRHSREGGSWALCRGISFVPARRTSPPSRST